MCCDLKLPNIFSSYDFCFQNYLEECKVNHSSLQSTHRAAQYREIPFIKIQFEAAKRPRNRAQSVHVQGVYNVRVCTFEQLIVEMLEVWPREFALRVTLLHYVCYIVFSGGLYVCATKQIPANVGYSVGYFSAPQKYKVSFFLRKRANRICKNKGKLTPATVKSTS